MWPLKLEIDINANFKRINNGKRGMETEKK
jgi:hypothetical protein